MSLAAWLAMVAAVLVGVFLADALTRAVLS